jgi:hypothetical protein
MKTLRICLVALVLALLAGGCAKDSVLPADRFIFGTYAVERLSGDGSNLYMVANGKAYADDDSIFNQYSLHFKSSSLDQDKYTLAQALENSLPNYLMQHPNTRFGCPGCVDQPSIYVEYNRNGKTSWWILDTQVDANPAEIRSFAQLLLVVTGRMK